MRLDELRRIAAGVHPIPSDDAPPGFEPDVLAFNGVVSRFREQLVAARNYLVRGHDVPSSLALELRMMAEALRDERERACGGREARRS
jgi:hypothetical protein